MNPIAFLALSWPARIPCVCKQIRTIKTTKQQSHQSSYLKLTSLRKTGMAMARGMARVMIIPDPQIQTISPYLYPISNTCI